MLEQAKARYDRPGLREAPLKASREVPAPAPAPAPTPAHYDLLLMRGAHVAKTNYTPKQDSPTSRAIRAFIIADFSISKSACFAGLSASAANRVSIWPASFWSSFRAFGLRREFTGVAGASLI